MSNSRALLLAGLAVLGWSPAALAQTAKADTAPVAAPPAATPVATPAAKPALPPAGPALAKPAAIPAAPTNTVRCVYDGLSIEDREISQILISLDFLDQGRYTRIAPSNKVVDRLVLEALPRCAGPFSWSAAASDAAVAYAHAALVQDVMRQTIESEDLKVEPIETYYGSNRAKLAGKTELDDMMEEGFATHLWRSGWKESERAGRRLARVYLELLIARDTAQGAFTKATTVRAPVKRPLRRAKTASRGRL